MTTRTGSADLGPAVERALTTAVVARVDAPGHAVVRLRGKDARRFCNGMFTNNVRDLPVGAWNRSAIVDDRARVAGFLDLLCEADDCFLAVVDGMDAETFCARYGRYVIFDDVDLETPDLVRWTMIGPRVPQLAPWPPEADRFLADGPLRAWRHRRAPCVSVDLVAPSDHTPDIEGFEVVDGDVLDALRILAKVPAARDAEERRLPHELGVREEMLHFEKGCYLGQETIHRVDVMGRVRKQLVLLQFDGPVAAGDMVRSFDGDDEIGQLTSVARLRKGASVGLAVLRIPHVEADTRVRGGQAGVPGRVRGDSAGVPAPE
ncbi:MAG: hypothetical protein H6735_26060 [Alphaproteobacteria bacterium]|nr:hypothetical protein [Alphaproteobacteria bacterium]